MKGRTAIIKKNGKFRIVFVVQGHQHPDPKGKEFDTLGEAQAELIDFLNQSIDCMYNDFVFTLKGLLTKINDVGEVKINLKPSVN